MNNEKETLAAMALSRAGFFHAAVLHALWERLGSVAAILDHKDDLQDLMPEASPRLVAMVREADGQMGRVEEELEFDRRNGIRQLVIGGDGYPQRLSNCPDAPLVLFYRGNADLNCRHIINVVGTRRCTRYGQDLVHGLMQDLSVLCPDVLVMSGLAYGVDICAHREALSHGLKTVGVLAHGLDELYPPAHRDTARLMVGQGGLLTEYFTRTKADKLNFVRRNRIVAGCCDATVLIESAAKGGGLITCGIANDYGRSVMAFPGPVKAPYSEGCNNLIRDNGARLITSADDLLKDLGWDNATMQTQAEQQGIERQLFPDLTDDQKRIVDMLRDTNDLQVNVMAVKSNMPVGKLMSLLFELEMKGVVKPYAGGSYHLIS